MLHKTAKALACFSAFLLIFGAAAFADSSLSILVVGADGDIETVPRSSDNFDHLLQGIASVVEDRGFAVTRESDIDPGRLAEGRVTLRPPELVELAQQAEGAPIDVTTAIQVYARAVKNPSNGDTEIQMNVSGRLFEVPTARPVGQYQVDVVSGDLPPVPDDCDNACTATFLEDQFETVGADVGRQLAVRLELIAR